VCETGMSLKVTANKTEALYFYSSVSGKLPLIHIRIRGTRVLVGDRLKYLGLLLNGRWRFGPHFEALAPRAEKFSAALSRILPNLGGSGWSSPPYLHEDGELFALYGALIWAAELAAARHAKDALRRVQRCMAARVTRAYCTVSHAASSVLASWSPLEFLAQMHRGVCVRKRELRGRNVSLTRKMKRTIRLHARQSMIERSTSPIPGQRNRGLSGPSGPA